MRVTRNVADPILLNFLDHDYINPNPQLERQCQIWENTVEKGQIDFKTNPGNHNLKCEITLANGRMSLMMNKLGR